MLHSFESIDRFLSSIEVEIVNCLFEHDLLEKFDKDAKKVVSYIFVKNISERLNESPVSHIFYYDSHLYDSHELFLYYSKEEVEKYIAKIISKIKKITNRIVIFKRKTTLPNQSFISDLDGSVVDEILLLQQKSVDLKGLKEFLKEHHLKDLFFSLSKKLS